MSSSPNIPNQTVTLLFLALYVLSGVCQPLLMTVLKEAGLADPKAQLYMVFYYFGPSLWIFTVMGNTTQGGRLAAVHTVDPWPSTWTCLKACVISSWDLLAQAMNYTGASLAGPTIFAIIYSSVTIWTALWARIFLHRQLNYTQWLSISMVFGGLTLSAADSLTLGPHVSRGTLLVLMGSAMHGAYDIV